MREGDDGAQSAADEGSQLVLGLGEPARRDRGLLRLEGERLARRERVELDRAAQVDRPELLLGPDLADVVGLPDEIGAAGDGRDEVVGDRRGRVLVLVVRERRLDEVDAAVGSRVDGRRLERVERALREGREGADALDLVAEELDAERLATGGRVDVHDAAAKRELAALLGLVDALVAGECDLLGEGVDSRLVAWTDADRLRTRFGRRHALGERGGGRADEAAGGEDVEGASPLADEMRRGLEARAPADAAAREERYPVVAEEPRGRFGDVSGVRVLGGQDDERSAELLVQRGDEERQRRLRDAGARVRQLLQERAEALAVGELADERVEDGSVHDERRNRSSAATDFSAEAARHFGAGPIPSPHPPTGWVRVRGQM